MQSGTKTLLVALATVSLGFPWIDNAAAEIYSTNAKIELLFAPSHEPEDAMVKLIGTAKKSVHVAAMSFDSQQIASALIAAKNRGADVRVVADKGHLEGRNEDDAQHTADEVQQSKEETLSAVGRLVKAGIPVHAVAKYEVQHSKIIVVDGEAVQTGSYNYTNVSRDKASENVLIIRDAPAMAQRFEDYWAHLWAESQAFTGH